MVKNFAKSSKETTTDGIVDQSGPTVCWKYVFLADLETIHDDDATLRV